MAPHNEVPNRWDEFCRKHPLILFLLAAALAVLATPAMLAASKMTAVLYKDF